MRFIRSIHEATGDLWDSLAGSLERKLQQGQDLDTKEIMACIKAMLYMAYDDTPPDLDSAIQQLCSQGYLMNHIHNAQASGDFEATAICLLSVVDFYPTGAPQAQHLNSQAGYQTYSSVISAPENYEYIVEAFARFVWEFDRLEALLTTPQQHASDTKPLVLAVLKQLVKREDAYQRFYPQLTVIHYDLLEEALAEDEFEQLVGQLVKNTSLLNVLQEQEFIIGLAGLYLLALKKAEGQDDYDSYADYLITSIREVPEEQWLNALDTESELLRLVIRLVQYGKSPNLTENFHDALRTHLGKVHEEELSMELQADWEYVANALNSDWKKTFFRDFRDFVLEKADQELSSVLALYGDPLLDSEILPEQEKADEIIRKLFKEIVEGRDVRELAWMAAALERHPEIMDRGQSASREVLAERVRDGLSDDELSDERKTHMKRIGDVLRVRARRKKNS